MIETRFKQTEIGPIPEDWEVYSVREDCNIKARIGWQGLTTTEYLVHGEYGLITGTDLVDGKVNWRTCVFVGRERYIQDPNIIVKDKDVLISKDGTIGKVAIVSQMPFPTTLNSGVFVVRTKNDAISQSGLGLAFSSLYFRDFINRLIAGSTIVHLYQKDIVNFLFPLPNINEQEHISAALTDVDELITAIDKLIAKKQAVKQGAMQQLLTGRKRLPGFSGPWAEKRLGEVTKTISPIIKINSSCYLRNGKYPVVDQGKDYIGGYSNEERPFPKNEYIIFGDHTCIVKFVDFAFHQGADGVKVLMVKESVLSKFIYYCMSNIEPDASYARHWGKMKTETVLIPPLDEQRAIAAVLSDMDEEIEALQAKRAKYEKIKQGMMQQLLSGRIRLIDPNTVA